MPQCSPPNPSLRQWPPIIFLFLYVLAVLVYICVWIFYFSWLVLEPEVFEAPSMWLHTDNIAIAVQSIILFVLQMIPFITPIIRGYRSNTVQFSNEECAPASISAIHTYLQSTTWPFDENHPEMSDAELFIYAKGDFVRYLANPYHINPFCVSFFSRRKHSFMLATHPLLALIYACVLFRDSGCPVVNALVKGFGGLFIVVWWCLFWKLLWSTGWLLKMGAIARQIRVECMKHGSIKGLEDVEKYGISSNPKERLKWWIRECWKGFEGGHSLCKCELIWPH